MGGNGMVNPWKEISLSDYENHMSLDSVRQLQSLNLTMNYMKGYKEECVCMNMEKKMKK